MQKDRIITVVLRIVEPEASKAIWEAHKDDGLVAGCKVLAIANDNILKERDDANDLLNDVAEYLGRNLVSDDKAAALLDRIEGAK